MELIIFVKLGITSLTNVQKSNIRIHNLTKCAESTSMGLNERISKNKTPKEKEYEK